MSHLGTRLIRRSVFLVGGLGVMVAAGCVTNTRPADVPGSAAYETGGRDRLVYVAPTSGTLYISDQEANAIIYSGPVLAGAHVVVDPASNRVAIDDQVVVSTNVNHDDHHIFLLPGTVPPPPTAALSSASMNAPRPMEVPPTAKLGAEGRDRVEYVATDSGVVWVTDATRNNIVYRTRVAQGDRITIDPAKNALMVNGTRAFNGTLLLDDYCIFLAPGVDITAATPAVPAAVSVEVGSGYPVAPASAVVMSESGSRGIFTATQPGTVWVTETTTGRVVFSGHMRQDDTLIVDPDTGRITQNGSPVTARGFIPGRYRVSFVSGT